jgi:hypothetical protein
LESRSEPFLDEKNLGIPFRTIFGREEPRNSVPNHFRKKNKRTLEFRSESFLEEKNLGKRQLLLAASLNFNILWNSVPFRFDLSYKMDSSEILGITQNQHFIPRNDKNRSESIPRKFFGTKF